MYSTEGSKRFKLPSGCPTRLKSHSYAAEIIENTVRPYCIIYAEIKAEIGNQVGSVCSHPCSYNIEIRSSFYITCVV